MEAFLRVELGGPRPIAELANSLSEQTRTGDNRHKVAFDLASWLASDRVLLGPDRELGAEGDVGDAEFLVESPMLARQLV